MSNIDNHHLTKKERYLLKKQKKEQERLAGRRRKKLRKIIIISLPIILITGGILFALVNYPSKEDQGLPKIEISPQEYDAGIVSMTEGLVKYIYEIKNTGDNDLKISNIETSCMCTTAILKVGNKESPEFSMHDNPLFWSQKISPGETGYLEVVFDPAFHGPKGTGEIIRAVYIFSNDPQNKKVELRLITNVIQ